MAGMAGNPAKNDGLAGHHLVEALQEVQVLERAALALPAITLPARDPLRATADQVLAVAEQQNAGVVPPHGAQCLDRGLHFHAVVGGVALAAGALQRFLGEPVDQDERPSPDSRVSSTA